MSQLKRIIKKKKKELTEFFLLARFGNLHPHPDDKKIYSLQAIADSCNVSKYYVSNINQIALKIENANS